MQIQIDDRPAYAIAKVALDAGEEIVAEGRATTLAIQSAISAAKSAECDFYQGLCVATLRVVSRRFAFSCGRGVVATSPLTMGGKAVEREDRLLRTNVN